MAGIEPETEGVPTVRTYAADMARAIRERGESLASIANTETARREDAAPPSERSLSPRAMLLIGGGVISFFLGIGVIVAALVFEPQDQELVAEAGIIFPNQTFTLAARPDLAMTDQLAVIRANQNLTLGEVLLITILESDAPLSGARLAEALGAPSALSREVVHASVGVHAFDRNQPFIIFEIGAYDRAYAALLSWEETMGASLGAFFTPTGKTGASPRLTFSDDIIRNLDVRRSQNEWPIIYTFPERGLLIITTNEFTLREILTRLGSARR